MRTNQRERLVEHSAEPVVAAYAQTGGVWDSPADPHSWTGSKPAARPARAALDAAGLALGDAGGVYIFECRTYPDRPTCRRFDRF